MGFQRGAQPESVKPVRVQTRPGLFWFDQDSLKYHTKILVQTRIEFLVRIKPEYRPYIFFPFPNPDPIRLNRIGSGYRTGRPKQQTRTRFRILIRIRIRVFWYFFRNTIVFHFWKIRKLFESRFLFDVSNRI